MSERQDVPTHTRWAQEARRRGRSVARITPHNPPNVMSAEERFVKMQEPTVDPEGEDGGDDA